MDSALLSFLSFEIIFIFMFGLFFKKCFFGVWDNLFFVIISNFIMLLGFAAAFAIALSQVFLPSFGVFYAVHILLELAGAAVAGIVLFSYATCAKKIASFETPRYGEFFRGFISHAKTGALFGFLAGLVVEILRVAVPFYVKLWRDNRGSMLEIVSLIVLVIIFWVVVTAVLSIQYFYAVYSLMGNNFKKCLRKCLILFFDNMGFSVKMFFLNLFNVAVSVPLMLVLPGIAAVMQTQVCALKVLLYKYDWIEVNPDLSPKERKMVPWSQLLQKERKLIGIRSIKSFFFPWKDTN